MQSLYGCNSVRIVVIIPDMAVQISSGRAAGARKMAELLQKLCPSFSGIDKSIKILFNYIHSTKIEMKNTTISSLNSLIEHRYDNKMSQE